MVIICPKSHDKLTKSEIKKSLFAQIWVNIILIGTNISLLPIVSLMYLYFAIFSFIYPYLPLIAHVYP